MRSLLEMLFFGIIVAPLIYIAGGLKKIRAYSEKQGWIFLAELCFVLSFPIRVFEDMLD